jgi:hypothetical protein
MTADNPDGEFDSMSHSGAELPIRNVGRDCALPALPLVQMLDRRGQVLGAVRQPPVGMHPGPVMVPVRLAAGHRAAIILRWVSGAVFDRNRMVNAATVRVQIGAGSIQAGLGSTLYGPAGRPLTFEQSPARAAEGMPAA